MSGQIHFRKAPGKKLSEPHAKANAAHSKVRSAVEHVFAHQKAQMHEIPEISHWSRWLCSFSRRCYNHRQGHCQSWNKVVE